MILKFSGNSSFEFLRYLCNTRFSSLDNFKILDLSEVKFVTPIICVLYKIFLHFNKNVKLPSYGEAKNYLSGIFFDGDTRYIPVIHLNKDKLNEELHYQIARKFINETFAKLTLIKA